MNDNPYAATYERKFYWPSWMWIGLPVLAFLVLLGILHLFVAAEPVITAAVKDTESPYILRALGFLYSWIV